MARPTPTSTLPPAPAGNAVDEASASAPGQAAPAAVRGPWARWAARLGWWLLLPLAVLVVLAVGGTAAGLRWLLYTPGGAQWALDRAPGVQATGLEGTLLGPELRATRLSFPAGAHRVTIEGLHAQGLAWQFRPRPGVWLALDAQDISARRVTLRRGPPSPPPTALQFPFRLALQALQIGEFRIDDLPPVQAISARGVSLNSVGAGTHGVQALALRFQGYALSGQARIGVAAPMPLQAEVSVVPFMPVVAGTAQAAEPAAVPAPPWTALISAQGPLQLLDITATLRGQPAADSRPGAAAPAVDLQARVAPFAAWPLNTLQLRTEALDLAALAAGAPQTALSGQAQVQANAADAPITATIELRNALPGRWNDKRLPVRELLLELQGSASARDRLSARRFEVQLADARGSAGRWTGSAEWQGHTLNIDTRLQDVQPQRLDSRAAAMRLAGPLKMVLTGLPALGPAAGAAPGAAAPERPPWSGNVQLQLDGRLEGAPAPVRLTLRARGDAQQVQVEEARAQSGQAVAELKATLSRMNVPAGPQGQRSVPGWRLQTAGSLLDFEPLPWWPGEAGSTWRQGPHRLSAGWNFDLRVPTSALQRPPLGLLQRVAGNGELRLHDAVLAGVPLRGALSLAYGEEVNSEPLARTLLDAWPVAAASAANVSAGAAAAPAPASAPASASELAPATATATAVATTPTTTTANRPAALGRLQADLHFGGNRLQMAAQGDPLGEGESDRWALDLRASHLAGLAPLARLHPALAAWVPRQGSLNAQMGGDGRWPALRTQGTASLQALKLGTLAVQAAQADWRVDSRAGDPQRILDLQLRIDDLQQGQQRLAQLLATASGTLASHRISLDASASQLPPAWLEKMLAVPRLQGTHALLRAEGSWTAQPKGGGTWRTRIDRVAVEARAALPAVSRSKTATMAAATAARRATTATAAAAAAAVAATTTTAPSVATPATSPVWAEARDLQAQLSFDAGGALERARAEPGQLRLADVATLRWDAISVDLSGPRPAITLRAELDPLMVAPLLDRAMPGMGWGGGLRVGASARIDAGELFEAELLLERLGGDLHLDGDSGLQLLGLSDVRLGLMARDGVWNFRQAFSGRSLGQVGANLRVRTSPEARWPEPQAPVEGAIEARVNDIGVWGNWVPPGWRLTGAVSTLAQVSGEFGAPKFTGKLSGTGLGVRNLLQGVNVTDGRISLSLDGDSATIETFTLRGGEGRLDIAGGATLGEAPQASLAVKVDRFRVLGRVDRQLITSGEAKLRLQRDLIKLDGRLMVDEGLFDASRSDAPSLDSDVSVRSAAAEDERDEPPPAARGNPNLNVNLDVDLGQRLRVRGYGLDTELRGQLRLTTPGGRLAVNGTVRTERGTYAAYAQKLEIERGIMAFSGAAENPRLDVLALRPNVDIRVGVAITGTLQAPRVRLFADPEMGETDKLAWLVLGRAPAGLGRTDTALLQRAAVALLAGQGDGPTDDLMRNLGLDDVSLRQDEGDVSQTVITVGKQLGRRWYLGYERGVNATTGTWQLIYRVAQRLTVRLQSGLEDSLDVIWVWRVGEVDDGAVPKSSLPSTLTSPLTSPITPPKRAPMVTPLISAPAAASAPASP